MVEEAVLKRIGWGGWKALRKGYDKENYPVSECAPYTSLEFDCFKMRGDAVKIKQWVLFLAWAPCFLGCSISPKETRCDGLFLSLNLKDLVPINNEAIANPYSLDKKNNIRVGNGVSGEDVIDALQIIMTQKETSGCPQILKRIQDNIRRRGYRVATSGL